MKKNPGRRERRNMYFKNKRFARHAKMAANERRQKKESRSRG